MKGGLPADGQQPTPTDPLELVNSSKSLVQNPTSDVLGTSSLNLLLTPEQAATMSKSILEVFELEEEPQDQVMGDGGDDEVDLEDQQRRTERLKGVVPLLAQLWWADSDQLDLVAEKLADGSRDREYNHIFIPEFYLLFAPCKIYAFLQATYFFSLACLQDLLKTLQASFTVLLHVTLLTLFSEMADSPRRLRRP